MVRSLSKVMLLAALMAAPLAAQSTGTPVFQAPYRAFNNWELGGSLSDPGNGWALEGFYRWGYKNFDIGIRSGIYDPSNGDSRFLIGGDARTRVVTHSNSFPLDGALTFGLGGNFGGGADVAYIPLGISLGRRILLENSSISFSPYVHPVLTPTFLDSSDLLFAFGLGVDVKFTKSFDLRVSGGVGDLDGVSISAAYLH